MSEGIALYGGFDGTETSRSQRNWRDNPTYLNCTGVGSGSDSCGILVDAANDCIIDGFILTGAQTSFQSQRRRMAGVYSTSIGTVIKSTQSGRGAGVFSNGTNVVIVNSIIFNNVAMKGGGLYCIGYNSNSPTDWYAPTIINTVFAQNTVLRGGAICADAYCHFTCDYCWFLYNRASEKGMISFLLLLFFFWFWFVFLSELI